MSDNPERVSFSFHLSGQGTMTADKQFSLYVSRTLDCIGKNQDMVKYRVKMYRGMQEHYATNRPLKTIIAGSKAEGLTSVLESDYDRMIVFPDGICADNVRPFVQNGNTTVFQTDRHDSPSGYTKLKVKYFSKLPIDIVLINNSSIQEESGDTYLSSELFITTMSQEVFKRLSKYAPTVWHDMSGPSLPTSDLEGYQHRDNVFAFRCVCPSLLQTFLTRPRPYNRPSRNELRDISVMEAHVVPVGHKGSNTSNLEWRICFTKAEIYLVQRLNETETKLYIILKMVSKLLKFISKDITSYVMKIIVLWLVEFNPEDLFTEDLLTYQLIKALRFLQKCVKANYLPSYVIPERNLFAERLIPVQKIQLTTFLSTLIQERGYLLLRCDKIRYGMTILYREPDMAEEFRHRRDMAEKLNLLLNYIINEKMATTGLSEEEVNRLINTDGTRKKIDRPIMKIILPEAKVLIRQGCSAEAFGKLMMDRLRQILS